MSALATVTFTGREKHTDLDVLNSALMCGHVETPWHVVTYTTGHSLTVLTEHPHELLDETAGEAFDPRCVETEIKYAFKA